MSQYNERVQRVETQMAVLVVEQSNLRTIVDKQNTLIESLAKTVSGQEYQTKAILERTDQHTKEMERLQGDQIDTGKILAAISVQLNLVKYVGGGLLTLIIGYLFSHFVK